MKKWLIASSVCLALILWLIVDIVLSLQQDQQTGLAEAQALAEAETGWKIVDQSRFHCDQTYFIFTMRDDQEQTVFAVVDEEGQVKTFAVDEHVQLSEEEAVLRLLTDRAYRTVKAVRPAYTNHELCWEIVAIDEEGRWHYVYYAMDNGQFIKRYTLEN
ncbi:hypothetical protein GCM10010965_16660 [Caldalkalibacillus thermarum]|uniref:hypothetical protein n=1 Tax=Caldalkalibacillus thermarum TaxID=296745 RepID=UPI0016643067|nr:hypothetical protein [Caldalkalibacillus thermarum]GGK24564.1 hypothetical protein GCM10010965_16660 [Caldalkalibacillus thermarum]